MAAYGSAISPPGQLVYRAATPYTTSPLTVSSFGSAVLPGAVGGGGASSAPADRAPGDYPAVFALKELAAAREVLYTAPAGTTAYIRYALLANNSGAARTVQLWLGGRRLEPGLTLAAGQAKTDELLWIARPGEILEALADGAGVDCTITGIEEVR